MGEGVTLSAQRDEVLFFIRSAGGSSCDMMRLTRPFSTNFTVSLSKMITVVNLYFAARHFK
jgi:hypothetical protein